MVSRPGRPAPRRLKVGLLAGAGGAWFTLEAVDVFNPMMTSGLGFAGLAA